MKPFTTIAVLVFSLMAIVHLFRLFAGWGIVVNGYAIPVWISLPGMIVTGGLAAMVWREKQR